MTLFDNRLALVAALGVTCVVTSCETLPDTQLKTNAGQAGQKPSSGGANAGGKAGSGGMGTSATAGKGTAGSGTAGSAMGGTDATGGSSGSSSSGAGTGGKGGKGGSSGSGGTSTDAGNGGESPSTPAGGDNGGGGRTFSTDPDTFFGDSRCETAGVAFCEDFEDTSLDTGSWTARGAAPEMDDTRAARGNRSAHFHTESNALQYITLKKVFPAPNNTYFARVFVWFDSMPTAPNWAHWTVSGALADGNDFEVRVGGQYDANAQKDLFGVGSDHGPTGDWTNLDEDQPVKEVPVQSWVCLEWMFKGDTNETKFWWDGVEHPSLATTSTQHGGSDDPWELPDFDSMWVGWWLYQENPVPDHYDVWIDEVAVDYVRIGCDL